MNEKRRTRADSIFLSIFFPNPSLINRPIQKYGISTNTKFLTRIYGNSLFQSTREYLPRIKSPNNNAGVSIYNNLSQWSLPVIKTTINTYKIAPKYQRCPLNGDSLRNRNLNKVFTENVSCKKSRKSLLITARNNFHKKYIKFASINSWSIFLICLLSPPLFTTSE